MARPRIEGLKYFPLDVDFDDQFKAMEAHHGNDFFVWIIKFWQAAYKKTDGVVDLSGIRGVFQAENSRITPGKQADIIRDCLDTGLLQQPEPEKYTSNGIKKRLNQVSDEREKARKRKENKLFGGKPPENTRTTGEKEREKEREIKRKEINKVRAPFKPPTIQEVTTYCSERNNSIKAQAWMAHYEANGWMIGKNKMKDWKASVRYWETSGVSSSKAQKYGRQEVSNESLKRIMEVKLE